MSLFYLFYFQNSSSFLANASLQVDRAVRNSSIIVIMEVSTPG